MNSRPSHLKVLVERLLNGTLARLGIQIVSMRWYKRLAQHYAYGNGLIAFFDSGIGQDYRTLIENTKSQRGQEIIAFFFNSMKSDGYFIEIGATDGIIGSNTFALEKLGWTGLLVEPARSWHQDLRRNRSALIDHRAVWHLSGEKLSFIEDGELSTFVQFEKADYHRRSGNIFSVETVSPSDLFSEWRVPKLVDFLSIDTEGSEFEILRSINFNEYEFGFICVEHNYTEAREKISDLLESKGYQLVLRDFSLNDLYFVKNRVGHSTNNSSVSF